MNARAALVLAAALLLAGCASSPFHRQSSASALTPQAYDAMQQSAAAAYAEGNAPAAIALYTQLVQQSPSDAQAWRRLGNLELLAGRDAEALLAYEHAVQLGGADAGVWHNVAVIRLHQAQAALQQLQAFPVQPGQEFLRADSARAAKALPGILRVLTPPMPTSSPAPAPGPALGEPGGLQQ